MPKLYSIYKKHEKRLKYALYIPSEKYEEIFSFLKNCENTSHYTLSLVSKIKYFLKQGTYSNYDSGILVLKNIKNNQSIYEYIKNHYLFIENMNLLNKENQLEKYEPIIIDIDVDNMKSKEKSRKEKKRKDKSSSLRNTLETILEDIEDEEDEENKEE